MCVCVLAKGVCVGWLRGCVCVCVCWLAKRVCVGVCWLAKGVGVGWLRVCVFVCWLRGGVYITAVLAKSKMINHAHD